MQHEPPYALTASDRARRAFLARVEEDLTRPGIAGLTLEYRALPPYRHPHDSPITTLVLAAPGTACEARVSAVVTKRQVVGTLPDHGALGSASGTIRAVEQVRADARRMGIVAVTKTITVYDPFPGDGTPEYEVAFREPFRVTSWVNPPPVEPYGGAPATVGVKYSADPKAVVKLIIAWAKMATQAPQAPPAPQALTPLRAVTRARRSARASVDWKTVAELRAEGRFGEVSQMAGIAMAFDPRDPDAEIDHTLPRPIAPSIPVAERMTRAMASSGMGAIIDVGMVAAMVERMRGSLPAPAPPPPPVAPTLTPEALVALRDDLAALNPEHLLWNLPCDEQGRLVQGGRVLLAGYDSVAPHGKGRRLWLTAALPDRRRDPQAPTLRLESLIGPNHSHRWDGARWLWDARETSARTEVRWGVAALHLGNVGVDAWRARLAEPFDLEGASEMTRALRGILLQDAGRLEEALGLYGVDLAPTVTRNPAR